MSRLTELALRWPMLTLLIAVILAAFGAISASRAPSSAGAHALLGDAHPDVIALEDFIREFGGGYPVVVAWSCALVDAPCRSVFDERSLMMASALGGRLLESPYVTRIAGPAQTPVLIPSKDELLLHRFVIEDRVDAPPEAIRAALESPHWRRTLISEDGRIGALVVESITTSPEDQVALVLEIEKAIAPFSDQGFRFYLSGNPLFHVASQREAVAEASLVGGATGVVVLVCLLIAIRSWQSVVAVLASIGLATGTGMGALFLFGWPWDPLTSAAPTLALVLGCADGIHFVASYWGYRARSQDRECALISASRETFVPCALTTATSIAGLLSFSTTESVGFSRFGGVTAAGVLFCLLMTYTVIPALIRLLPDGTRAAIPEARKWEAIALKLVNFPLRNSHLVLGFSAVAAVAGSIGLTRLNTDADPMSYWRKGHPTRASIEFVSQHLTSIEGVEVRLQLAHPVEEAGVVSDLLLLQRELESIPSVRGVRSLVSAVQPSATALGVGTLTETTFRETLAVLSLGDASTLDQWISIDHRALRFSISSGPFGVEARERLLSDVARVLTESRGDWTVGVTGPSALQESIDDVVRNSALQAFSWASLLVGSLVVLFVGSFGWGVLAMIPNLLPMVVLFGLMGFFGIALDAGTALVAPIAVGIAVDDTVHFLHAFVSETKNGAAPSEAVRLAGLRVGRAVATTSATLAAGFLAMLVSRFQSMANMGLLSAAAIASAFAAEILVLPALIARVGTYLAVRAERTEGSRR